MEIICANCGKTAEGKGSIKHPYCEKCFEKVWDNDYKKYMGWLFKTHM